MNGMNSNMIGNIVSQIAVNKFQLDMSYSIVISMMVSSMLMGINTEALSSITSTAVASVGVLVIGIYLGSIMYKRWNKVDKSTEIQYKHVKIYQSDKCGALRHMMKTHPEFYTRDYDMEIGNPKFNTMTRHYIPEINTKVYFTDTKFGVKGYVRFEEDKVTTQEGSNQKVTAIRCMAIYLEKDATIQCDEYLEKLEKYYSQSLFVSDRMTLWSVKIMARKFGKDSEKGNDEINHYVQMYTGPKDNHEERHQKWFSSYFSPHKDRLWKYLSSVHYRPEVFHQFGQGARCNLLLHGPPGTGKSTFVYRLAMSLGRHIVSLDLTALGDDRTKIYQVVQRPTIQDRKMTPDQYIVLLEEFDIAVTHLKEKNKRPDYSAMYAMKKYSIVADSKDEVPSVYTRSTREFELEDLLEILQGPVPLEGSIIIATTNKYEEIKNICPALFRPGRLTPVEFGYLDWASLQEMSRHYFKKELTFGPIDEITISSSEIIELAMAATFKGEKGFEFFENALKGKLKMVN